MDDDTSPPGVPIPLTGTVYSTHEIELFWQASTDDGWVMGYDVYRDGVLLTEQLDANSYFDDTVAAGTEYVYTVLAVDDDGNRSTPATITLITPPDATQPLINRDNYSELLSHVIEIYVGDIYNEPLIELSDFIITGQNPDGSYVDVHDCESGGFTQVVDPSSTLAGTTYQFEFDACFENGLTYDGTLSGQNSGYAETLNFDNGISIQVHPELKTTFTGSGVFNTSMSRTDTLHQWKSVGVSVDSTTITGTLQLGSVTTAFGYGSTGGGIYQSWLNGGFTVRSDTTSGALLTVSTPVEMAYECDPNAATPCTFELPHLWAFTEGQIEVVAEDGSMLLLDADTSTQETLNITISNSLGTETIEAQWSEWQPELSFQRFSADSSDWVSAYNSAYAEQDASPAIRPDNYVALLDHVFETLTGHQALDALSDAQNFLGDAQPSETTRASGVRVDRYTCDNSGTATAYRVDNDTSIYPLDYQLEFDRCNYGEFEFNGDIRGQEIRADGGATDIDSITLQWLDGSGIDFSFLGQSSVQRTESEGNSVCTWDAERISLHAQADASTESVVNGNINLEAQGSAETGMSILMSGTIQIMSEKTEGFEIAVSVSNLEIAMSTETVPGTWNLVSGDISLKAYDKSFRWASDHSTLTYNVADASTEIESSEGNYSFTTPWVSWQANASSALARLCRES